MSEKKIVGYTTGVFDLFHIGHLNILKAAKKHCDYLIVGVSTDELVQAYKHKTPVIPYQERRAIVEAIKYVDQVVPQTNRDKMKAWEEYRFDKMFVGDDWKSDSMFQQLEKEFRSLNVEICYFPYTKGVSSTILTEVLNKIRNQ
ncbi:MAG: FAD synthase [Clostridia bacterium]|nr:FAD synthase [Clostridia bacterium]